MFLDKLTHILLYNVPPFQRQWPPIFLLKTLHLNAKRICELFSFLWRYLHGVLAMFEIHVDSAASFVKHCPGLYGVKADRCLGQRWVINAHCLGKFWVKADRCLGQRWVTSVSDRVFIFPPGKCIRNVLLFYLLVFTNARNWLITHCPGHRSVSKDC